MARALLLPLFLLAARCAAEPPIGASPALDLLHDNKHELFSVVTERVQILIHKLLKSTAHIDPPRVDTAISPQLQVRCLCSGFEAKVSICDACSADLCEYGGKGGPPLGWV